MKTKPFLLATAGSTVDGRTIDDKMLKEMAESYDPKTYGARLNIEHIRGISGQAPFRAFGDVLEVSTAEVDVNFNGKTEKRLGLFGTFDVTDEAKALNEASQKVYPSIEIEPNFAGKGFAYLMGCALTDSPASVATDRLQFNRARPGALNVAAEESALLEFAEEGTSTGGDTFLTKLGAMLDGFSSKLGGRTEEKPTSPAVAEPPAGAFDFTQLKPMFEEFGKTVTDGLRDLQTEFRTELDAISVKLTKVEKAHEETPSHNFSRRPPSDGGAGNYAGVF